VLWLPMQVGSLWGPFAVGAAVWWRLRRWRPAVGSVVVGVLAWQLAKVLKAGVSRGRPYALLSSFARRTGTPYDGLGFVSGHSAVAFSLASVLAPHVRGPKRALLWVAASLVGLARIQVSAHLPLDVVGGAGLGVVVGNAWNVAVGVPAASGSRDGLRPARRAGC
jgi:membrane-associated phospholipid phosphatase